MEKYVLDIDASGGKDKDCAQAIKWSLRKLSGGTFVLRGQTTDSGGGGALEGLADALRALGIISSNYIVAACTIHCLQLQLSNPVLFTMGQGKLETRNLFQLLHSCWDLQECLSRSELIEIMDVSANYCQKMLAGEQVVATTSAEVLSLEWFRTVQGFRNFSAVKSLWPVVADANGNESFSIKKIPQPVLTRWQYVGQAADVVWRAYLLLFRMVQVSINTYGSLVPGKISSGLQPLMRQPELFSDLALLKDFHNDYFTSHLSWMMASKDLTQLPGFQCHQIAVRYYLMDTDLFITSENILEDEEGYRLTPSVLANFVTGTPTTETQLDVSVQLPFVISTA